ncbi:seryl-tRNA synthetase [Histoplasma capsulatum H143]|uniref:serine--tRNA ligase n=1 Tax=Ajellomyces capsulatus (strain H143) TaxID=544712 RepID=C6HCC0_AJECH|nr:seryl-tRNA synthetase [Histoplasma capsulatum H143]
MPPPQMAVLRNPCVYLSCRLHTRRTLTTPSLLRRSFSSSCRNLSSTGANTSSRPPTAPKPTPDIKHIRENASLYSENCIARNYHDLSRYPYEIQRLSTECRELQDTLREPQRKIKQIESAIAQLMANSSDPHNADPREKQNQKTKAKEELSALRLSAQQLKDKSHYLTTTRAFHTKEIERLALSLPNLTSTETPPGAEPRIVNYINYDPDKPANLPTHTTSHVTIGTTLNLLNFTSASLTSGWGWYYLTNEAAMLEQALIQYALSVAIRRGWQAVSPPSLVYSHITHACGFQPRDAHNEQQIYHIEQSERDVARSRPARCLAGTAEIPLAAIFAGQEMGGKGKGNQLPVRMVGVSRCYRAEAGARGADTRGLYRVHEFTKVELFGWAMPDPAGAGAGGTGTDTSAPTPAGTVTATTLFDEILALQTEILTALNLPCRVLEMPAHDLGASAARKRDIEVLFPSRIASPSPHDGLSTSNATIAKDISVESGWGEVTSASNCTDYQTRRLGTRLKSDMAGGAGKFPHTVNGTAMAVPRIIAALLEHGWDENRGVVVLPDVLRGWMGGKGVIGGEG